MTPYPWSPDWLAFFIVATAGLFVVVCLLRWRGKVMPPILTRATLAVLESSMRWADGKDADEMGRLPACAERELYDAVMAFRAEHGITNPYARLSPEVR